MSPQDQAMLFAEWAHQPRKVSLETLLAAHFSVGIADIIALKNGMIGVFSGLGLVCVKPYQESSPMPTCAGLLFARAVMARMTVRKWLEHSEIDPIRSPEVLPALFSEVETGRDLLIVRDLIRQAGLSPRLDHRTELLEAARRHLDLSLQSEEDRQIFEAVARKGMIAKERVLAAAKAEYEAIETHRLLTEDERRGMRMALRGIMVRLNLYNDFVLQADTDSLEAHILREEIV